MQIKFIWIQFFYVNIFNLSPAPLRHMNSGAKYKNIKKNIDLIFYFLYDDSSIDVQGDNTGDKGLISAPFALLSLRVSPGRVDQVPERGRNHHLFDS